MQFPQTKFTVPALVAVCLGVLLFSAAAPAQAADIRSGERVVIDAATVIDDDLYVTAREIVIDGTVKGDVYAFGNIVTMNGVVERDVIAGAQDVFINGTIGDTLRAGGQTVVLGDKANIAHTALLAAFAIETKSGSVIGHDLVFGAYQAALGGTVQHDVIAGAGGIEISGTVGRNVRVSVGENDAGVAPTMFMPRANISMPTVPPGLTIAPTAKIGGDLVYESNAPVNVPSSAQVTGPIVQQTPTPDERRAPPTPEQIQAEQQQQTIDYFLNALRDFVILLLIGLLVLWLLPKWIGAMADFVQTKPLGSFGRGILMVVGYFVAAAVLVLAVAMLAVMFGLLTLGSLAGAVVLVGTVLFGVLTVGYWLFITYVAPIVVSYLIGRLLLGRMQAAWAQNRFVQFTVGLILLSLVLLIPVVDFFVGILVAIFALGALLFWITPLFERKNAAATPMSAV
jgi:cytoskeletal protein CcmA (bactofilin family)